MINKSFNSDFDALFNEGLLDQIFQIVPKLVGGLSLFLIDFPTDHCK